MAKRRHIAVVTGSRADLGLLVPVLRAIAAHRRLRLSVVVTGPHLARSTWREVTRAGFAIAAKVPMQRQGRTGRTADVQALGRGVIGLGRAFARLRPEIVLVLGDRIETLAAALAAHVGGIHLAHIHGGDRAEGVSDEAMRHAVSKLAHLHFPATAQSRRRLIRMGEPPKCVFNVGSPAIDGLREVEPAGDAPGLIVLQHPIGGADAQEERWMRATLAATRSYRRLVLAPNSDPGCAGIRAALRRLDEPVIDHLPRHRFLALLAGAKAVVGNSSAGLIEAAALRVPCVNIGPRQAGRERPNNVIDCDYGQANVAASLKKALAVRRRRIGHPYGAGGTGRRIARLLAACDLAAVPLRKRNTY